jgi:hypothetical protein
MSNDIIAEFNKLKNDKSLQITLNGKKYWVVEGDLIISETELLIYVKYRVAARQQPLEERSRLVAETDEEGRIKRWAPGLVLTYAVLKRSFLQPEHYDIVVDAMHTATNDWESICGVQFEYRTELDGGFLGDERPLFVVEWQPQQKNYIAVAFFPDWLVERRRIIIFDMFFDSSSYYEPAGILRHELGHVLGFRHEHIHGDAPVGCPKEDTASTFNFGAYDPQSVMHYLCGGVGDRALKFTQIDREGARTLYGPPHH